MLAFVAHDLFLDFCCEILAAVRRVRLGCPMPLTGCRGMTVRRLIEIWGLLLAYESASVPCGCPRKVQAFLGAGLLVRVRGQCFEAFQGSPEV